MKALLLITYRSYKWVRTWLLYTSNYMKHERWIMPDGQDGRRWYTTWLGCLNYLVLRWFYFRLVCWISTDYGIILRWELRKFTTTKW